MSTMGFMLIASWILMAVISYAQHMSAQNKIVKITRNRDSWKQYANSLQADIESWAIAYERLDEYWRQATLNPSHKVSVGSNGSAALTLPGMPELPKNKAYTMINDGADSGLIIAVDKPQPESKVKAESAKGNGKAKDNGKAKGESKASGEFSPEIIDSLEAKVGKLSDAEKSKYDGWLKSGQKFDSDTARLEEYAKRIENMRSKGKDESTPSPEKTHENNGAKNGHNGKAGITFIINQ